MATAAPAVTEPDDLTCSVCHELFVTPKLLPCAHVLCRHCLLAWMTSHDDALCPLCRCAIAAPEERGGKSWEDVADGLPSDLAMADLVHAHRTLHEQHDCVMCESEAATALCVTCGDMFCAACSKFHVKQSVTKHHQVAPLTSLTSQQVSGRRHATCAVHRDKPAELFCPEHDVIVCHVCATSRHRGCSELRDVEERVEEARAVLQTLTATLTAGEARLDLELRRLDDHVYRTEKESQAALAELKTVCQRLEAALTACRQHVEDLTRAASSDVTGAAKEAKACLLQRRARLTSHKHVVQRVQDSQDGDTVTAMTPVIKTRVEQLDCSLTLPDTAKVVSKVTVLIDHEAVTRIEKELSQLGQVKVMPADVDVQIKSETEVLTFHSNCGKNIVLSNDNQTAARQTTIEDDDDDDGDDDHDDHDHDDDHHDDDHDDQDDDDHDDDDDYDDYNNNDGRDKGIVVSSQPMKTNTLYEVCVDKKDSGNDVLDVGVTTAAPDTLTLPCDARSLSPAVVITQDSVHTNTTSDVGQQLDNLPEKSRVGVLLDDTRSLHLYINGVDQGVAAPSLTQPCYPFFDVYGPYRQVTGLPVTRMQ